MSAPRACATLLQREEPVKKTRLAGCEIQVPLAADTSMRLHQRISATVNRPVISADDLQFLLLMPALFVTALVVPERNLPRVASGIQKFADALRPSLSKDNIVEA